jgi:adenosylhomocysteine nucleosidase
MGTEAYRFLAKVEVRRRWAIGKTVFRLVFFEGDFFHIVRCGVGPQRAANSMKKLDFEPSALICVGTAGALTADLDIGDIVVCDTVLSDSPGQKPIACDEDLAGLISASCDRIDYRSVPGKTITVSRPVFPRHEREELRRSSGADCVEMETHAIGLEAAERRIPFAALRVISDNILSKGLPPKETLKTLISDPLQWRRKIPAIRARRAFLKKFNEALEKIPPILVRILRDWDKRG